MPKKNAIIAISTILVIFIAIIFTLNNGNTIKDETAINNLKNEANLDILINLGNYSITNHSDEKLLDVSMQIASKLGLLNEYIDENNYIQYVTRDELHLIIFELTGLTIEAPIEIEDFYYLYDSENEYYYYRPSTPSYFSINKIHSLKKNGINYEVMCSISKSEDLDVTSFDNVLICLTYEPNNTLVKFKVNEISYETDSAS